MKVGRHEGERYRRRGRDDKRSPVALKGGHWDGLELVAGQARLGPEDGFTQKCRDHLQSRHRIMACNQYRIQQIEEIDRVVAMQQGSEFGRHIRVRLDGYGSSAYESESDESQLGSPCLQRGFAVQVPQRMLDKCGIVSRRALLSMFVPHKRVANLMPHR